MKTTLSNKYYFVTNLTQEFLARVYFFGKSLGLGINFEIFLRPCISMLRSF